MPARLPEMTYPWIEKHYRNGWNQLKKVPLQKINLLGRISVIKWEESHHVPCFESGQYASDPRSMRTKQTQQRTSITSATLWPDITVIGFPAMKCETCEILYSTEYMTKCEHITHLRALRLSVSEGWDSVLFMLVPDVPDSEALANRKGSNASTWTFSCTKSAAQVSSEKYASVPSCSR